MRASCYARLIMKFGVWDRCRRYDYTSFMVVMDDLMQVA